MNIRKFNRTPKHRKAMLRYYSFFILITLIIET